MARFQQFTIDSFSAKIQTYPTPTFPDANIVADSGVVPAYTIADFYSDNINLNPARIDFESGVVFQNYELHACDPSAPLVKCFPNWKTYERLGI